MTATSPKKWHAPDEDRTLCSAGKQATFKGFSLLEMMIVVAIGFTIAGITAIAYVPVMKSQHVTEAYNTTLTTLRRAHDQAQNDMRIYLVQFSTPGTITVSQTNPAGGNVGCVIPASGSVLLTATLPPDVTFQVESGVPTSNTTAPTTPDTFGTAGYAIDFDQGYNAGYTYICFNPNGTASDGAGNLNNGVVYLGRANDEFSARAITLWGATGRLRGWRLYPSGAGSAWSQQ
jgi:prepilin-type N-terminal cleavage/methylation domain-containing protein